MNNAPGVQRRRVKRGSSVEAPQGFWSELVETASRGDVLLRLAVCLASGLVLLVAMQGWAEPFPFRVGMVPPRGVAARVPFEKPDAERTRAARERATAQVRVVYSQHRAPIVRMRDGLKNRLAEIAAAESLTASSRAAWLEFAPEAAAIIDRLPSATRTGRGPPVAPEPPEMTALPPKDAAGKDAAGKSASAEASAEKDVAAKENAAKDTATKDDPARTDAAGDGASKDGVAKAVGPQDGDPKDGAPKDGSDPKRKGDKAAVAEQKPAGADEADKAVAEAEQAYQRFRARITSKDRLLECEKGIDRAFADLETAGVLEKIQHGIDEGSQTEIDVHPLGNSTESTRVQVADVLLGEAKVRLKQRLDEELGEGPVAPRVFSWIEQRLAGTLEIDRDATAKAKKEAVEKTPQQFVRYAAGDLLADAGTALGPDDIAVLEREHGEYLRQQDARQRIGRALSLFGLFVALFALSGLYLHRHHRDVLDDLRQVGTIAGLAVLTTVLCLLSAGDTWRAEIVPLLVFAMTVAIAFDADLALLLAAEVALVVVVGLGLGLADYVTLAAASAAMIFSMGRIRSRSRLVYVGLWAAAVAILTQVGASLLAERPFDGQLLYEAGRTGVWTLLAASLMTSLLPFIERSCGVLTDLSLLEVGDVAHPLLQELVRRAPGTYNHSINVASIGEAAAEAIGARGLLVRVGAYFHDVGKMLKPSYFIENQSQENRHESLVPAMSTLIIVAHVKEGVELARQHNLPQPIVDIIAEHHGTTLVEYFYRRATELSQADPNGTEIDEQSFRYPGPKPSSRESAVLMLADAVESAGRALTEPTPARIAGLVHELAMKRLLDGQFDECGLTLEELQIIESSLVKSLTAVYHGRVKYPDQRTA
jgi:putative nucleotidyltransferase with HDIG domain